MSKLVQKWKKVVSGCVSNKSNKHSLIENDFLLYDEFYFKSNQKLQKGSNQIQIYNESGERNPNEENGNSENDYDNLQHQTKINKRLIVSSDKSCLKEATNVKNSNTSMSFAKGFKRRFISTKTSDKKNDDNKENCEETQKFVYAELYETNKNEYISESKIRKFQKDDDENVNDYCEILENSIHLEDEPLINLNNLKKVSLKSAESKINLFTKFENDSNENYNKDDDQEPIIDEQQHKLSQQAPNLTEIRQLDSFCNHNEAYHWYLNLITETMMNCIKNDSNINEEEKIKRYNICTAHLLYSRNFYELKIKNSNNLKINLANIHPCMITLACLLDSDAVRIVESHGCTCDTYIYLFSTRLKFCAWKAKLYIILKKPKRSSIDRLTLIEDLTNCHKIIQIAN